MLSLRTKISLKLQSLIAYLFFPILFLGIHCWLRYKGYRIRDLALTRRTYRRLIKSDQSPRVICANHLSYVDSLLIAYALADFKTYLLNFKALAWNLPKRSNVQSCWYYPFLCYVGKCVQLPLETNKAKAVLAKIKGLLALNETVLLFPEGTRSQNGMIDVENVGYGVGELISGLDSPNALLIYLRGDKETGKSKYPKRNQFFTVDLELRTFELTEKGRRAHRQIAKEVILSLKQLEERYFAHRQ